MNKSKEEFEEYIAKEYPSGILVDNPMGKMVKDYMFRTYLHQQEKIDSANSIREAEKKILIEEIEKNKELQEKIDDWKRSWSLEMAHSKKCEERIKELEEILESIKADPSIGKLEVEDWPKEQP